MAIIIKNIILKIYYYSYYGMVITSKSQLNILIIKYLGLFIGCWFQSSFILTIRRQDGRTLFYQVYTHSILNLFLVSC